jgi:biopolymer transport protein ExbD
MRRFSQRSALVTLSEINITPLLDLAFVLLIIFVITTPLLDQGITLAKGGKADKKIEQSDIRTVEISPAGGYKFNHHNASLEQIEASLEEDFRRNPNLIVYIRADERGQWKDVAAVMDFCQQKGIKMSARTQPPGKR